MPEDLAGGRFDAAIRNGHGRWPGLRTTRAAAEHLHAAVRAGIEGCGAGRSPIRVARCRCRCSGRPDWWALWYRALGLRRGRCRRRASARSCRAEHLDIAAAVAGHGVAIGSPILFRNEIASGRLVPAHDLVAGDGRSFWLAYPVARQNSRKIAQFREWLCDEAASDRDADARTFIRSAVDCRALTLSSETHVRVASVCGCGFNRSTKRIGQSVLPAFRSGAFLWLLVQPSRDALSTLFDRCPTGPFLSGRTAVEAVGVFVDRRCQGCRVMARAAHPTSASQALQQLFLQGAASLDKERAINRLVGAPGASRPGHASALKRKKY